MKARWESERAGCRNMAFPGFGASALRTEETKIEATITAMRR
jgi:hypothetical protein